MNRRGFLGALAAVPFAAVAALQAPAATITWVPGSWTTTRRPIGRWDDSEHGTLAGVDDGTYISNYHGFDRGCYSRVTFTFTRAQLEASRQAARMEGEGGVPC